MQSSEKWEAHAEKNSKDKQMQIFKKCFSDLKTKLLEAVLYFLMTQNMLSLKRVLIWGQYFSYIDQDR
jgi:hypothetical protein